MKKMNFIAMSIISLVLIIGCSDTTTNNEKRISGKVVFEDMEIAANTAVYIFLDEKECLETEYNYHEKVFTNSEGMYDFEYSKDYNYRLYSNSFENDEETHCSQYVEIETEDESSHLIADDIILHEIRSDSELTLHFESIIDGVDTDSVAVTIKRIIGSEQVLIDTFVTSEETSYQFEDLKTGYYVVSYEKTAFLPEFNEVHQLMDTYNLSFINGIENYAKTIYLGYLPEDKPVIYIYPEKPGKFEVSLLFKDGVSLVKSIPEYKNGWSVFVNSDGKIEDQYDYLFYEAIQPQNVKFKNGVCFSAAELEFSVKNLLKKIGLNEKEIHDFWDYWKDHLDKYPFYNVYPIINSEIDKYVELKIEPQPDSVLRVWFFYEGVSEKHKSFDFQFKPFIRNKTVVVEWGGVLMN